ncbi:aspartate aminotransferase family protein [Thetidibacter halocola]|uniref:Aspartate aminotransferase family protein n=1 Tax=Thetidibacter halocola TaxID=2827239 RepID=A0A8J7WFP3_9RHOB|nr:aspartate aminotransferase family protein [Thetidibacter halocola]MBS0124478.1 aspartate aminotransferase family protein [Thetidibacter halocola]
MTAQPALQTRPTIAGIDPARLEAFRAREEARFVTARPRSKAALEDGAAPWLNGVPMHWMRDWPSPFPLVVKKAEGARLTDVDGHRLDDFCLGDTGSMFGHSPEPVARAIRRQATRGLTYMLPSKAALRAGALLCDRFGPFLWQVTLSASDANRHALRVARAITGRRKVLVFNGCYHGTLQDTMVELRDGRTTARAGLVGQGFDLTEGAVCVEFNDLAGVEAALARGDVAAILTEPVMTNSCMVLPEPGFLDGLRRLADGHGALLIIDETHTQSSGAGGYTRVHGLKPDIFVIGKCVAGGMPTALWGMTEAVADRFRAHDAARDPGHSGMGTTLAGNPMQFACLEATLTKVATDKAFARMDKGAARLAKGLSKVIEAAGLPWHVVRVGARVEFICAPGPLRNGTEAAAAHQPPVEAAVHLGLLNRGCLIAPFHNMMLVSPITTRRQIDRLVGAFADVLAELKEPESD